MSNVLGGVGGGASPRWRSNCYRNCVRHPGGGYVRNPDRWSIRPPGSVIFLPDS
jgi:hypothetical protein